MRVKTDIKDDTDYKDDRFRLLYLSWLDALSDEFRMQKLETEYNTTTFKKQPEEGKSPNP